MLPLRYSYIKYTYLQGSTPLSWSSIWLESLPKLLPSKEICPWWSTWPPWFLYRELTYPFSRQGNTKNFNLEEPFLSSLPNKFVFPAPLINCDTRRMFAKFHSNDVLKGWVNSISLLYDKDAPFKLLMKNKKKQRN